MPEDKKNKNHDGPHVWSSWMTYNRSSHYRHCMVQFCPELETREAKA